MNIGGYTDWYIPSKDEMEVVYRNLKPTTANNVTSSGANASAVPPTSNYTTTNPARTALTAFQATAGANYLTAGVYGTATQGPGGPTMSHTKGFTNGADSEAGISIARPVRVIRRVLL
jgi:hypothetical protein